MKQTTTNERKIARIAEKRCERFNTGWKIYDIFRKVYIVFLISIYLVSCVPGMCLNIMLGSNETYIKVCVKANVLVTLITLNIGFVGDISLSSVLLVSKFVLFN